MQRKAVRHVHVSAYRGLHLQRVVPLAVPAPLRHQQARENFHEPSTPAPGEALEVYVLRSRDVAEVPHGREAEAPAFVSPAYPRPALRLILQEGGRPHPAHVVRNRHVQNLLIRETRQHRDYARLQALRVIPGILYQVKDAQVAPERERGIRVDEICRFLAHILIFLSD